jgi:hypothetical protein
MTDRLNQSKLFVVPKKIMHSSVVLIVALCIAASMAAVTCNNGLVATSVLESDGLAIADVHMADCSNAAVCQLSCSNDYRADMSCPSRKNPTPVDALHEPYAINVYLAPSLGLGDQYTNVCVDHSESSHKILAGLDFIHKAVNYNGLVGLVQWLPASAAQKERFLKEVKAGLDLCVDPKFREFWVKVGRKCSKSIYALPDEAVLRDLFNYPFHPVLTPLVKLVNGTSKWPILLRDVIAMAGAAFDTNHAWRFRPEQNPNVFWSYFSYLANLRSVCKCRNIVQAMHVGTLPDRSTNPALKKSAADIAAFRQMGADLCVQKYGNLCKLKKTKSTKTLEFGGDEETLENTF